MTTPNTQLEREIAGILGEHEGVVVAVAGIKGEVRVRPLSLEDGLDLNEELTVVGQEFSALLHLAPQKQITPAVIASFMEHCRTALRKGSHPLKKLLERCVDKPLKQIALPLGPAVVMEFLQQNFTAPHLKPWAALVGGLMAAGGAGNKSPGTSATPASSSATTATADTADATSSATPPTSSSSGSGAA